MFRNGTLRLDGIDLDIARGLTRSAFEADPAFGRFVVFIRNEPYCSYRVDATIEGEPFYVVLWFKGPGPMWRLTLDTARPEIVGQDWGDYDLPASVDFHEAWLDAALGLPASDHPAVDPGQPYVGPVRKLGWATAVVGTDPHNGTSEIVIDYET